MEFFPPKTEEGVSNLYLRMDRMTLLQPLFVDVTWGAGGSTKDLTMAISEYSQTYFGVDVLMHLTCTNLTVVEIKTILNSAKEVGIRNILALRGDPPKGKLQWEPFVGGCQSAIDLVRIIRETHGDYFCIGVAGFPEGHPATRVRTGSSSSKTTKVEDGGAGLGIGGEDSTSSVSDREKSMASDVVYLKEKVDAGADFILTQFFYDPTVFLEYQSQCRKVGISCPVIPGIMPIQSYSSFKKMTFFCQTKVPDHVWRDLEPIRDNDDDVKAYGIDLCSSICRTLSEQGGVEGFHFYTLNLEKSVLAILKELGIDETVAARRALPWRGSRTNLKANGRSEDVRPINWANRPKSYIQRTVTWDEFPNGRWGDNRSPAFGELSDSHFFRPAEGSKEDRLAMWGDAPVLHGDIYEVFAMYIEGSIPILPWCEAMLHAETSTISQQLARINRCGFLTINSQPAINGAKSDHSIYGWGGPGGRVYQKAYAEFFASLNLAKAIFHLVREKYESINFYAVNNAGEELATGDHGVIALTWGVFPNKEILQPTIFDRETFVVWSQEAFQLWLESWASLYDDETESSSLLYHINETYYLVALVDNDFIDSKLYDLFEEIISNEGEAVLKSNYGVSEERSATWI
jgi:methylenetetrahydrofolate reductase (NADPH)